MSLPFMVVCGVVLRAQIPKGSPDSQTLAKTCFTVSPLLPYRPTSSSTPLQVWSLGNKMIEGRSAAHNFAQNFIFWPPGTDASGVIKKKRIKGYMDIQRFYPLLRGKKREAACHSHA